MGSSPVRSTNHIGVAQLVEYLVWDQEVAGSKPAAYTIAIIVPRFELRTTDIGKYHNSSVDNQKQ